MPNIRQLPPTSWEREPVILTPERAALVLGISQITIRRLARSGELPAFKVGGMWRFEKSALMAFAGIKEV